MELALFENYEQFINEHSDDLSNPSGALKMITDNGMYRAYMDSLTEGLDPRTRNTVLSVANRQREMLLTEAANVPGSTLSFGWTVLSFQFLLIFMLNQLSVNFAMFIRYLLRLHLFLVLRLWRIFVVIVERLHRFAFLQ